MLTALPGTCGPAIFDIVKARNLKHISSIVIVLTGLTVGMQGYTLYGDYQENKQLFIREVQQSLDNSVELYFAELAKKQVITFSSQQPGSRFFDSLIRQNPKDTAGFYHRLGQNAIRQTVQTLTTRDSIYFQRRQSGPAGLQKITSTGNHTSGSVSDSVKNFRLFQGHNLPDSLSALRTLTNTIVISIARDTLDFPKLAQLVADELQRAQLDIGYALRLCEHGAPDREFIAGDSTKLHLSTVSKSTFLLPGQKIELDFPNASWIILRKGLVNILFSLSFILLIGGAFIYLYAIIKAQKELSEIKNDLINNITHEFKTPIATISAAVEGIRSFNSGNDPAKTSRYLHISSMQLSKLNLMVEKLLETATVESDQLRLDPASTDLSAMVCSLTERFRTLTGKYIHMEVAHGVIRSVDIFHFENAVSNLIDNAIKYGGDRINVTLTNDQVTEILIQDTGMSIPKNQQHRIFEKFYRIPHGNLHDVKGYGMGLYYSKNIVEKHGGSLKLTVREQLTTFKITLP